MTLAGTAQGKGYKNDLVADIVANIGIYAKHRDVRQQTTTAMSKVLHRISLRTQATIDSNEDSVCPSVCLRFTYQCLKIIKSHLADHNKANLKANKKQ